MASLELGISCSVADHLTTYGSQAKPSLFYKREDSGQRFLLTKPAVRVCRATPAISEYLYVKALDKLHLDRLPAGRRKKLHRRLQESSCIGDGGGFPALKREYGYEYFVCTFQF